METRKGYALGYVVQLGACFSWHYFSWAVLVLYECGVCVSVERGGVVRPPLPPPFLECCSGGDGAVIFVPLVVIVS